MKALITGASSGIGKDMAIYLGELGYHVVLVSSNKNDLEDVAKYIDARVGLEKAQESFERLTNGKDEAIKIIFKP